MAEIEEKIEQMRFDRKLGYLILLLLFLIILGCVGYGIVFARTPRPVRVIAFDTIGNLRMDDPVTFKGMDIGKISEIKWRRHNVLVFIETHKKLVLHQGYTIDNKDVGIMGDRALCIEDGDFKAPTIPPADTLIGTFQQGVSEAVGVVWRLRGVIDSFTFISSQLLHGAPGRPSLVRQINAITVGADLASVKLLSMVAALSEGLSPKLDSLDTLISAVARFAQTAAKQAPPTLANVERLAGALNNSLDKIDTLAAKALAMTKSLDAFTAGKAGGDRIAAFKIKIDALHEAIVRLKDRLVQLKISL